MKKKTVNRGSGMSKSTVFGASLAALAAGYFFLGPKGKKHRKHARVWGIKMKGDVIEKLEKVRNVSKPIYHEIVDSVATEYKKGMKSGHGEIADLARDLKKHWKVISRGAKAVKRDILKDAGRVAKKAGL